MNELRDQLPDDQTLDALLAQARWPEQSGESLRHLRQLALRGHGRGRGRGRGFSRMQIGIRTAAAVAAVVLLAIGGARLVIPRPTPPKVAVTQPVPTTPLILSRNPTLAEQAILYSRLPAASRPAPVAKKPPLQAPSPAELARRLDQTSDDAARQTLLAAIFQTASTQAVEIYLKLIEAPATSYEALAALENVPDRVIDELFHRLDDPLVSRRMAAARALGRIDGPVITERLAGMVKRNENRREALAALVTSEGRDATDFIARASRQRSLASEIRVLQSELNNPS